MTNVETELLNELRRNDDLPGFVGVGPGANEGPAAFDSLLKRGLIQHVTDGLYAFTDAGRKTVA